MFRDEMIRWLDVKLSGGEAGFKLSPAGAGWGARPPITLVSSFLWMSGIFHRKRLWKLFASERVLIYLLIILDYHTFHAAGWKKPLSGKITKSLAYLVTHKIPLGSWKSIMLFKRKQYRIIQNEITRAETSDMRAKESTGLCLRRSRVRIVTEVGAKAWGWKRRL